MAVTRWGSALQYVSELKNNFEFMKILVIHSRDALGYASQGKNNLEFMKFAASRNSNALYHASSDLQKDFEFMKFAVSQYDDAHNMPLSIYKIISNI